jgi:hypothetical protein
MVDKIARIVLVLGLSILLSVAIMRTGLANVILPMNKIAGPMVCGDEQLVIKQYASISGQETITAYCVSADTDVRRVVTDKLNYVTSKIQTNVGVIFGLLLFGVVMIFLNRAARKRNISFDELFKLMTTMGG